MKTDYKFVEYGRFSSEFEYSQLFQLCIEKNGVQTGPFGSQLHKEDYVAQGTPIITVEHLGDNRIIHIDTPFVTDDDKNRLQKYQMKEGDIIFSRVGSVDRRALVRKDEDGWLFSGRCLCVRVDKTKINPTYLSYFFGLESFKKYIRGIAVGATMPSINTKILSDVPVYYPKNLNQQKQIAKILSDLDDKIHLNNQINQTLESIAQAIFKSWFIDFEPVRAKISAKQTGQDPELAAMYAISGKSEAELEQMAKQDFAELQATAALFPDELVESELGEVPKGWEISKISKIGKVITGKTPSSKIENSFAEKGTFFITPTDIDTEVFVTNTNRYLSEYGEIAIKNSKVDEGSLCITCIGSQMGKVVITPKSAFTNQQINSILLFNSTLRNYIFLNLRQRRDEIFLIGSGGSTMPIINKSTFESLNLILPDLALIRKFDNFISPFFNNILSNSVENIELKNIRDALLPELLAGKINVSMLKDM